VPRHFTSEAARQRVIRIHLGAAEQHEREVGDHEEADDLEAAEAAWGMAMDEYARVGDARRSQVVRPLDEA